MTGSNQHSSLPLCDQPECTRDDHLIGYLRGQLEDAETCRDQWIIKHGDLVEQYENLKEQLDGTGKAAVREARRSADFLARAENAERKWAVERDRANGLLEQLQAAQEQLHAEQRDRNWWAANNSRERQQLQEQYETLRVHYEHLRTHLETCPQADLLEQLETMEWFLRHRTADEGMTQWDVYEQCDWSAHPEFASNPASGPETFRITPGQAKTLDRAAHNQDSRPEGNDG